MSKQLKDFFKITISLGLGIFIFWLAYRKMDTKQIFEVLSGKVHYKFIVISIFIGILSNLFRGLRWKILIDSLDEQKPTVVNTFFAVLIGYFVNFLFPRAGEIVRCGIITKYHQIAITKVIGTMLAERAFDLIVLILMVAGAFLIQMKLFPGFIEKHISFSFSSSFLWILIILVILFVLFYVLRNKIKNAFVYKQIVAFLKDILFGIKTSLRLKKKFWFLFYTVGVWGCYFLMLYIPIFAFEFTSHLSVVAVFFTLVMGSLGTLVPVQGGIGAWHFMTIISLGLFGVGEIEAGAFALIVHGAQMFSYMLGGIFAFVGLPFVNKSRN